MNEEHSGDYSAWEQRTQSVRHLFQRLASMGLVHRISQVVLDELIQRMGPHQLSATQAQILATRLSQDLGNLIAACRDQQRELNGFSGWRNTRNPVFVQLCAQSLAGITEELESVLATCASLTGYALPSSEGTDTLASTGEPGIQLVPAAPTEHPMYPTVGHGRSPADVLRIVHQYTVATAEHIRAGISGPQAANPFALKVAIGELYVLVAFLRAAQAQLWAMRVGARG
jgi:hypothetical protein